MQAQPLDAETSKKGKTLYLEGVRGFACLMVILSHLVYEYVPHWHASFRFPIRTKIDSFMANAPFGFIYSGNTAVSIFFVLSGIVLTKVILNSKNPYQSITSSVTKRYFRLALPAVFSCILIYIASVVSMHFGIKPQINNASLLGAIKSGAIDSFFSDSPLYNVVLWTMKIELFGSLLVFFMCACMISSSRKNLVVILFLLISILSIKQSSDIYYLLFILGSAIEINKPTFGIKMFTLLAFLAAYLSGYHYQNSSYETLNSFTFNVNDVKIENSQIYNGIAGLLFVMSVCAYKKAENIFSNSFFVFLGKLSFSAYLVHMVVIFYINKLFISYFTEYAIGVVILSFVSIIVTYLISIIFELSIDKFSIKLSNSIGRFFVKKGS